MDGQGRISLGPRYRRGLGGFFMMCWMLRER